MNKNILHTYINKITYYVLTFSLVVLFSGTLWANKSDAAAKLKTRIKIEYLKKGNNAKQIKATLSSKLKRKRISVSGVTLNLFNETDSSLLIKSVLTDKKGVAVFTLPDTYPIGKDGEPGIFTVKFNGNDTYKAYSKTLEVKDVALTAKFKVVDSVYTVQVTANELVNGNIGDPVSDVDVYVYVKRLFSLLKVGEGWLQDGEATVEIPNNIPGNLQQNLDFVVMIPEADDYGTVETNKTMKWGTPLPKYNKYADEAKRALWEPRAPIWMVITLGVLLFGVFYHYFLIAYKLYKIKKIFNN